MPIGDFSGLVLATIAFLAIHLIPSSLLRGGIVRTVGEPIYMLAYSILSMVGLVWMVLAFNASDSGGFVWYHAGKIQYVSAALMFVAFVLAVGGLTTVGPTAVGGKVQGGDPATGFHRISRHPFLVSVVLWSCAHLLVRGEMRAIIFFGGLGLLAAVGTVMIDRKAARRLGTDWERFRAATSIVPFLAIMRGRNRLSLAEMGWWRLVLGIVIFGVVIHFHDTVVGAYPLP